VNMLVSSSRGGTSGYGNLPYVLSLFQSTTWWLDSSANVHVCSNVSLFSSYQVPRDSSVIMGNGLHASVHGVGTIDLKLTLKKIMQLKNVHHVPSINKNLVNNIYDGYVCGGLFRFSVTDFYNKSVNNICDGINKNDVSVWYSHLCHLNFDSMSGLSILILILNLSIVKGSKCQHCVQSKQP
jgi:hypothetical protein